VFLGWAKILDCGDAPLTFLDNTVALKQLEKSHRVVAGRKGKSAAKSSTPRIITLGGDHTTTLAALRAAKAHWHQVSVIHFDSHIGMSRLAASLTREQFVLNLSRYMGSQGFG